MSCEDGSVKSKLSPCSLGFAMGIIKGLYLLIFSWVAWLGGYGTAMVEHYSHFVYRYAPDFVGGLFGGLWGFICGFIFGFILAWLYNFCSCCCKKSCK